MKNISIFITVFTIILIVSCSLKDKGMESSFGGGNTRNGSVTRIVTYNNHVYVVGNSKLKTINVSNPQNLQQTDSKTIGSQIQTVYISDNRLYIGAVNNLFVYGLTNPAVPTLISTINYTPVTFARDPVIAFDSVVYSTVIYGPNNGLLRAINNKNIQSPFVVRTIPMNEPRGMDYADSTLYVSNGLNGLTLFNIKQPFNPVFLKAIDEANTLPGISSTANNQYIDVIAQKPYMYCYVKGGIVQYNISNSRNPIFMNKIN